MKARFVLALALLLSVHASSALAQFLEVVGTSNGVPDPGYPTSSAIPLTFGTGDVLTMDFSACIDVKLCDAAFSRPEYSYVVTCGAGGGILTITALAPFTGFRIVAGGTVTSPSTPGNSGPCAISFFTPAGGAPLPLGNSHIIVYDKNGAAGGNGLTGVDTSLLMGDVIRAGVAGYVARSDHSRDGVLSGVDISRGQGLTLLARSINGCATAGPTAQPYCP